MIEFSRDGTFDVAVDESKKVTADHGARFQFMYQVLDEAAIYQVRTIYSYYYYTTVVAAVFSCRCRCCCWVTFAACPPRCFFMTYVCSVCLVFLFLVHRTSAVLVELPFSVGGFA